MKKLFLMLIIGSSFLFGNTNEGCIVKNKRCSKIVTRLSCFYHKETDLCFCKDYGKELANVPCTSKVKRYIKEQKTCE